MTREDAIYCIKNLAVLSTEKDMPQIEEALNMAVEALADRKIAAVSFAEPAHTVSFENAHETKRCSKDTISRQAAIEEVETRLKAAYVWYDNSVLKDDYALSVKAEGAISAFIECVLMLKGLPSAEPDAGISWLSRRIGIVIRKMED